MSLKSEVVWNRRPGLVGLRMRMAIVRSVLEQRDLVPRCQGDDRPLGVGLAAVLVAAPGAGDLALAVHRVDLDDLDAPDGLDGVVDLRLAGVGMHLEGVDALLDQPVGLLRDRGGEDDVARILHLMSSSASAALSPRSDCGSSLALP